MTDAPVVGSAAFELRAKREQMKRDLEEAKRDLSGFTNEAEREVGGATSRIGGMVGKVTAVVAAMTAVFAAGLAMAMHFGKASLEMADTLASSARRIGVSTDALQEWQYVARQTGEDAKAVSGDLEAFAGKWEQAAAGVSKSAMKPFAALGFSQAELRQFKDAGEALEATMDRIYALRSANDRAAITDQFGLKSLATAAREGGDRVDDLRTKAHDLGFTLDAEIIRKGADAQGRLEDLSEVIGVQMAEAFINLSDEVIAFTGFIANATKGVADFFGAFNRGRGRIEAMFGKEFIGDVTGANDAFALGGFGEFRSLWTATKEIFSGRAGRMARAYDSGLYQPVGVDDLADIRDAPTPPRAPRDPRPPRDLIPAPSRTRVDHSKEREARRAERVQEEINRARARALQIEQDDLLTVQERYDLREKELKIAREGEDADLQSRLARKDLTKAEFDQLSSQNVINRGLEDRIAKDQLGRDLADERLAQERALADLTAQLLALQSGAARTADERRRIELEMLEAAQRQRREDLQTRAAREKWTPGQLAQGLSTLDVIDAAERSAVNRSTMGPLEAWRDRTLKTAEEINEAYESIAVQGLDALNDGIVDAIMNSRSLGEAFTSVANSIIADLLRIAVRQSITEPLANWLFGGDGGGQPSGGRKILSSIGSFFGRIPGFSSGVTNFGGGLARVHAGELLVNLPKGTDVIPAGMVGAASAAGGGYQISVNPSPYFDVQVQKVATPGAVQAGVASYQATEAQRQRAARIAPYARR